VRISSWRAQKRIFRGVDLMIDGRTEISDTIDPVNYILICIVIIIQRRIY